MTRALWQQSRGFCDVVCALIVTLRDSPLAHDPFSQWLPASGSRNILFFSFLLSLSLITVHAVLGENTAFYPWLPLLNKLYKFSLFKILMEVGNFLTSSVFYFWNTGYWFQPKWKLPKTHYEDDISDKWRNCQVRPNSGQWKQWDGAWWICYTWEESARLGTPHLQCICLLLNLGHTAGRLKIRQKLSVAPSESASCFSPRGGFQHPRPSSICCRGCVSGKLGGWGGSVPSKITPTGTFANTASLSCSACRPATLFPEIPLLPKCPRAVGCRWEEWSRNWFHRRHCGGVSPSLRKNKYCLDDTSKRIS